MTTVYDFRGTAWADPATQGQTGAVGDTQTGHGTNAASYYSSSDCKHHCTTQQGTGPKGNPGHTGHPGNENNPGLTGKAGKAGTLSIGDIKGDTQIYIGGGQGQKGGKGGTGGPGSAGGPPGSTASGCNNNAGNGAQGEGGKGGDGGPGGKGGPSDYCAIYFSNPGGYNVQVIADPSPGGDPGDPGDPGQGTGNLGPGGPGTKGDDGPAASYDVYNN